MVKQIKTKTVIYINVLLLALFVFSNCGPSKPKEYIYYYEKTEAPEEPKVKAAYHDNNFRVKCELGLDSVIKNKGIVSPLSVKLFFLGRYQYYPKNLRFELYVDNKRIILFDTVSYHITTVIDDHVTYLKDTSTILNIPELITRIKAENNLSDSLKYFEVISVYPRYYLGNTANPETVHMKLKLIWDGGEETSEMNYILKKVEYTKEEYRLPIRPYG